MEEMPTGLHSKDVFQHQRLGFNTKYCYCYVDDKCFFPSELAPFYFNISLLIFIMNVLMLLCFTIFRHTGLEAEYKGQKMAIQMFPHPKAVTESPSRQGLFWVLRKLVWVTRVNDLYDVLFEIVLDCIAYYYKN